MVKSSDVTSTCAPINDRTPIDRQGTRRRQIMVRRAKCWRQIRRHGGVPLTASSQMPFGCIRITRSHGDRIIRSRRHRKWRGRAGGDSGRSRVPYAQGTA
jgi:hypothetical protein